MFSLEKGVHIQDVHADGWKESPLFTVRLAQEKDFYRLKEWGFDHVSAAVAEDALEHGGLARAIEYDQWAALHGLGLVLTVNSVQAKTLENVLSNSSAFAVAPEDYAAVRALNPLRLLILRVGDVFSLSDARVPADSNIVVSFSYDYPTIFTHQAEYENPVYMDFFDSTTFFAHHLVRYPSKLHGLTDFLEKFPSRSATEGRYADAFIDKNFFERVDMAPLAAFRQENPQTAVYCDRFGCNNYAPEICRTKWAADVISLLRQYGAGLCWDCYLGGCRGLVDPLDERVCNTAVIQLLTYDAERV